MATKKAPITETQKTAAEEQIRALRKEIDYNTRDYSIDFLIQQFRNDEFYIQTNINGNIFGMIPIKTDLLSQFYWAFLFRLCSFRILKMVAAK